MKPFPISINTVAARKSGLTGVRIHTGTIPPVRGNPFIRPRSAPALIRPDRGRTRHTRSGSSGGGSGGGSGGDGSGCCVLPCETPRHHHQLD
jgi:hypothetical protein